jgi:hypothetical protein
VNLYENQLLREGEEKSPVKGTSGVQAAAQAR